jgi:DNA-binding response OmpR family regulator
MKHVLIIENESLIRNSIGYAVVQEGYPVTTTSDIEEGKVLACSGRYDLIITDILPNNMKEVMKLIENTKSMFPNTKIVVITAHLEDEMKQTAEAGNIDVFCAKPFELSEIRRVINSLMREEKIMV